MTTTLEGWDIAIRLLATIVAGGIVGLNREEHGQAAGLRTTVLVALASALAMILVNLLLHADAVQNGSFFRVDPMRIPLGVLSGMGFIGGGAILRHQGSIRGVTTAATLWFVTVMGLCFGAGELILGVVATALAIGVLVGLKRVEDSWKRACHATLRVVVAVTGPSEQELTERLERQGLHVMGWNVTYGEQRDFVSEVVWRGYPRQAGTPLAIQELSLQAGVTRVEWKRD